MLTNILLDKMKKTARETGVQGRIINVSSMAYRRGDCSCFDLNKLNDSPRSVPSSTLLLTDFMTAQCRKLKIIFSLYAEMYRYHAFTAYCHSKLANILHANELARRFQVCNPHTLILFMKSKLINSSFITALSNKMLC